MTPMFRTATFLCLWLLVPAVLSAQKQSRTIFVNALDASGAPVLTLTAADFEVREGDTARPITFAGLSNSPMRIMLLVDTGEAMTPFQAHLKSALTAFIDGIPAPHEIGIMSIGRQAKVLQAPITDRAKLKSTANKISVEGGGVALLDGLLDSENRFEKKDGVHWPVYVLVVGDENEASAYVQNEEFKKLADDLMARGTTVHAVLIQKIGPTMPTDIATMFAKNTGGANELLAAPPSIVATLKAVADRIVENHAKMATHYQIEYTSDAKYAGPVDASVKRDGVTGAVSIHRSF